MSGLHRLYLTDDELNGLCSEFGDYEDFSRIHWKNFVETIDRVFTIRNLDKNPLEIVVCPPSEVSNLPKAGTSDWHCQPRRIRDVCQEAVAKIRDQISKRKLNVEDSFKSFDRPRKFHVSQNQMRQVILSNGILLSDEEICALENRYKDDQGFDYVRCLNEIGLNIHEAPLYKEFHEKMIAVNRECPKREPNRLETDIVQVLTKIKGQAVRKRIRIKEFLKDYDRHNEQCIIESNFRRGLENSNIILTLQEMDLICNV